MKSPHLLLGTLGLIALPACTPDSARHPNVIYVFPDQFRNAALEFWGEPGFREAVHFRNDPVRTPNLNAFAKESLVLSSAMSNCPLSSPHRGCLLTGLYPNKSGVPLNCNSNRPVSSLREDATCISDVFAQAGYDCAYFGKLHAEFPTPNDPEHPGEYVEARRPAWDAYIPKERRHGFNYWYAYGTYDVHKNPHYWDTDGVKHEPKEWSPLHEAGMVVKYLKNEGQVRNRKKPFFIMVGMNPPHSPYRSLKDCMEEDFKLYKDQPLDSLLVRPNADPTMKKAESVRYYFASVTGVDRAFGQILLALKDLGLDKNTIVVFASDHGETMCSQHTDDPKNSPFSESMNVPFIVRYPGRIQPHVDDLLLSSPDIMPTLLGLAGLGKQIPADLQGKDYSDLFLHPDSTLERPTGALYIQNVDGEKDADNLVRSYFPSARGLKTQRYTLALYIDKAGQLTKSYLFDDQEDPYQMNNLPLEENPLIVKPLYEEMARTLKEIQDPWYEQRILPDLLSYEQ